MEKLKWNREIYTQMHIYVCKFMLLPSMACLPFLFCIKHSMPCCSVSTDDPIIIHLRAKALGVLRSALPAFFSMAFCFLLFGAFQFLLIPQFHKETEKNKT
jgi:hypothetical protein